MQKQVAGQQLMLVTNQAKMIRLGLTTMRVIGRNSAGVRLFDVAKGEHVVGAARIDEDEEPENAAEEAVAEPSDSTQNFSSARVCERQRAT